MQSNIISWAEKWSRDQDELPAYTVDPDALGELYPVAQSAALLAESSEATAIVVVESGNGETAQALAACRPDVPVVVACKSMKVCRQLMVSRGLYPVQTDGAADMVKLAKDAGFAGDGPVVVLDADGKLSVA